MKATQRMATRLIDDPKRPRCHGPRGASAAVPLRRQARYTGMMYEKYSPMTLTDVTTAYVPLLIVARNATTAHNQMAGAGVDGRSQPLVRLPA